MDELARDYSNGLVDYLDGFTVLIKDCWFNYRPGNTEPLLRLVIEAESKELLDKHFSEIKSFYW